MAYAAGFHKTRKPVTEEVKTSLGAEVFAVQAPTDWGKLSTIDLSRATGLNATADGQFLVMAGTAATIHVKVLDQHVSVEDISAQIESPGNPVPISLKALSTELVEVQFTPVDAGVHKVTGHHPDTPMEISVSDASKCKVTGEGLTRAMEDMPAVFILDPKVAGPGNLRVQVEGPNSMAKVSMEENRDGTYKVTYIPVEVGLFTLKAYWSDSQIPGSPYHIKATDPRKVRLIESSIKTGKSVNGVYPMVRNEIFKVLFETSEAGPGIMQADLDTPTSRVPLNVETETEGRHSVSFIPDELGEHELKVTWSGYDIKESPIKLFSKKGELPIDHTKVKITGDGREVAKVA